MKKLGFGILVFICTALIGCSQSAQTATSPQAQPMQPDLADSDRGGMH